MGGVNSEGDGRPGWLPFDLLGHPVPANKGAKARPMHAPTAENLEKAVLLYGMHKSDADVAAALGISIPTLKKHYFASPELQKIRRAAKAFVEGELIARLNEASKAGKVGATEKLLKRLDKAALGPSIDTKAPKAKKVKGVKEERRDRAFAAGLEDKGWSDLIGPTAH